MSWADDFVLMSTSQKGLQNCLNHLYDYCSKWGLSFNAKKTKCMIFGKGKINNLVYNNFKVEQVNNYTYLGVNIHKTGDIKYSIDDRIKKGILCHEYVTGGFIYKWQY